MRILCILLLSGFALYGSDLYDQDNNDADEDTVTTGDNKSKAGDAVNSAPSDEADLGTEGARNC